MTASQDEAREELRNRYADVIRIAAGLAANQEFWGASPEGLAQRALAIVIACEQVCGIGGDA